MPPTKTDEREKERRTLKHAYTTTENLIKACTTINEYHWEQPGPHNPPRNVTQAQRLILKTCYGYTTLNAPTPNGTIPLSRAEPMRIAMAFAHTVTREQLHKFSTNAKDQKTLLGLRLGPQRDSNGILQRNYLVEHLVPLEHRLYEKVQHGANNLEPDLTDISEAIATRLEREGKNPGSQSPYHSH